ncbi:MAG: hypothetical protein U0575_05455 [Phycisphaerales bacterium]
MGLRHPISITLSVSAICLAAPSATAGSPSQSLYALTTAGQLVTLDPASAVPTIVRVPLPAPFTSCDSLEYVDGWFYASYAGGKVVRFGFSCGDQVDLGPSGFPALEAIARRGDGVTFASVSFNNDFGAEAVGTFNPANGHVTGAVASGNQSQVFDIDAMAFAPDNSLRVINLSNPLVLATFDVTTGAISNVHPVTLLYAGAVFTLDGSAIYGSTIGTGACAGISNLVSIAPATGAETLIGSTGLNCIVGLTWGPPAPAGIADLNHDGLVNGADLGILLAAWGTCPAGACPADLNCDGKVDGGDLGVLLAQWT